MQAEQFCNQKGWQCQGPPFKCGCSPRLSAGDSGRTVKRAASGSCPVLFRKPLSQGSAGLWGQEAMLLGHPHVPEAQDSASIWGNRGALSLPRPGSPSLAHSVTGSLTLSPL